MTIATTSKVLLHSCPRCRGDLFLDEEGPEYACLQCGRALDAHRAVGRAPVDALLAEKMFPTNRRLQLVPRQFEEIHDDAA